MLGGLQSFIDIGLGYLRPRITIVGLYSPGGEKFCLSDCPGQFETGFFCREDYPQKFSSITGILCDEADTTLNPLGSADELS